MPSTYCSSETARINPLGTTICQNQNAISLGDIPYEGSSFLPRCASSWVQTRHGLGQDKVNVGHMVIKDGSAISHPREQESRDFLFEPW